MLGINLEGEIYFITTANSPVFISQCPLQNDLNHHFSTQVSYFCFKKKGVLSVKSKVGLETDKKIFWISSSDLEEQTSFIMSFASFKTASLTKVRH